VIKDPPVTITIPDMNTGDVAAIASFLTLLAGCLASYFRLRGEVFSLKRQVILLTESDHKMETSFTDLGPKLARIETLLDLLVQRSGITESQ